MEVGEGLPIPDIGRLETTVAIQFGYLNSLERSSRQGNRIEASLLRVGMRKEQLEQEGTRKPLEIVSSNLLNVLCTFSARRVGWSQEEIESSVEKGRTYAKNEIEYKKLTGNEPLQAWFRKRLYPQISNKGTVK